MDWVRMSSVICSHNSLLMLTYSCFSNHRSMKTSRNHSKITVYCEKSTSNASLSRPTEAHWIGSAFQMSCSHGLSACGRADVLQDIKGFPDVCCFRNRRLLGTEAGLLSPRYPNASFFPDGSSAAAQLSTWPRDMLLTGS